MSLGIDGTYERGGRSDWRTAESYRWTATLPASGWAWEFLRRNPEYRASWRATKSVHRIERHEFGAMILRADQLLLSAASWGMLSPLEDPNKDARTADVFWSPHVLAGALKSFASEGPRFAKRCLPVSSNDCRMTVYIDPAQQQHVLFAEGGRNLQLEVGGSSIFDANRIFVDPATLTRSRHALQASRQFAAFLSSGRLEGALFPPFNKSAEFAACLQALDGMSAGAGEADIGIALYGLAGFERRWTGRRARLFKDIRTIIARAQSLMMGGYQALLKASVVLCFIP